MMSVQESNRGLFQGTISTFTWKDWRKNDQNLIGKKHWKDMEKNTTRGTAFNLDHI
jgi:hypothetical protein